MAARTSDEVNLGEVKPTTATIESTKAPGIFSDGSTSRGGTQLRPLATPPASTSKPALACIVLTALTALAGMSLSAVIYTKVKDLDDSSGCGLPELAAIRSTETSCESAKMDVQGLSGSLRSLTNLVSSSSLFEQKYVYEVHKQQLPSALRPPGFETSAWVDVLKQAEGESVDFYHWSGDPKINAWLDNWFAPKVLEYFQVTVTRIAISATSDAVDLVAQEVEAGITEGSVGLIWINGVNFASMKAAGHLYGPWADRVPNSLNFDFTSKVIAEDKGIPTEGLEMPYNTAQSVFITTLSENERPKTVQELIDWVKANPGKFTYANPTSDFTGALFVRFVFHAYAGGPEKFTGPLDTSAGGFEALYEQLSPSVWTVLNEIEPYLWSDGAGLRYPAAHNDVQDLFASQDILLDLSYNTNLVGNKIEDNLYPEHTVAYVLDTGTITNTNFVTIPINAKSKAACMVVGNFIAQMESMFTRTEPERWGALQAFDPEAPHIKNAGWNTAFDYLQTKNHESRPTIEQLAAGRLGELHASYVARIEEDWEKFVLNKGS